MLSENAADNNLVAIQHSDINKVTWDVYPQLGQLKE